MKKNDTDLSLILIDAGIRLVSVHLRSQKELETFFTKKLHRYGSDDREIVGSALERLRELGYVDDRAYAHAFVASRNAHNPKGNTLLRLELRQKGVDEEIIADVLCAETEGEFGVSEIDRANALLLKKKNVLNLSSLERKKKIFSYLSRRGFRSDTIRRVIDGIGKND